MKSKAFEEKLVEILARTLSGEVTPVEYALSNEPSKTKGKVNQVITFVYEVDEPTPENSPKLNDTKKLIIDEKVQGAQYIDLTTEQLINQVVKNIDDNVISVEIKKRHKSDELEECMTDPSQS
ncbi:hypothetical protein [Lactococcus garvieae]|uniref:hypothetical protein n=1 Tax=Lactococcus garvieae TaxID=1363 RepID=UPI00051F8D8F|nr:hypothetical protein [Lactococcus garvieae]CEF51379.1 hypothetical protein LGMT14_01269 [Lactococcus garvieae]